jgi:hypothetical protein
MENTPSKYRLDMWTRAGSRKISLIFFENNTAEMNVCSEATGYNTEKYRLSCLHQPVSEEHGFLRVLKIEDAETDEEIYSERFTEYGEDVYGLYLPISGFDLPDVEILYEYIRLRDPQMHISGDRTLDNMRFTGSAEWNDTFDLFLYLLPLTNVPEESAVHKFISGLDKLKLKSADQ